MNPADEAIFSISECIDLSELKRRRCFAAAAFCLAVGARNLTAVFLLSESIIFLAKLSESFWFPFCQTSKNCDHSLPALNFFMSFVCGLFSLLFPNLPRF